jgi:hypothetical protein
VPIDILTAFMEKGLPLAIPSISSGDAPAMESEAESEPEEKAQD